MTEKEKVQEIAKKYSSSLGKLSSEATAKEVKTVFKFFAQEKFFSVFLIFAIGLAVSIRGKKWMVDFPIDLNKLKEEDTHFSIEYDRKFISKVYRATVLEDYVVLSARKYGTFI